MIMSDSDQRLRQFHDLEIASMEGVINDLKTQNKALRAELETYRRDPVHVIELRDDGFTIQHPLSCRPNLFDCIYNYAAASTAELGQHPNGRFKVTTEGEDLIIGEEVR